MLQSMENQECPKSKTTVHVAPEMVLDPGLGLRQLPQINKQPEGVIVLGKWSFIFGSCTL